MSNAWTQFRAVRVSSIRRCRYQVRARNGCHCAASSAFSARPILPSTSWAVYLHAISLTSEKQQNIWRHSSISAANISLMPIIIKSVAPHRFWHNLLWIAISIFGGVRPNFVQTRARHPRCIQQVARCNTLPTRMHYGCVPEQSWCGEARPESCVYFGKLRNLW